MINNETIHETKRNHKHFGLDFVEMIKLATIRIPQRSLSSQSLGK